MTQILRRDLLKLGGMGGLALGGATGLFAVRAGAAADDYRAAVCVFLFGGCDSNNLVVPASDAGYGAYLNARRSLAIPRGELALIQTPTGETYGLHPHLAPFKALYGAGRMAVLANVGALVAPVTRDQVLNNTAPLPDNLLSHADQQTLWQTMLNGVAAPSGWGGRLADVLAAQGPTGPVPGAFSTAGGNVFCDGQMTSAAVVDPLGATFKGLDDTDIGRVRRRALVDLSGLGSDPALSEFVRTQLGRTIVQSDVLDATLDVTFNTVFPATDLGAQLRRAAQIMARRRTLGARRQVFFIATGGYDTHEGQIEGHNQLLPPLAGAITAFDAALGELGLRDQVVTFTHSEFSRTLKPAGPRGDGTDHAWGGHALVFGGPVRPGVHGAFPTLELGGPDDISDEGRWAPTTAVDQYAATIARWMGAPPDQLTSLFPALANFPAQTLPFLGA